MSVTSIHDVVPSTPPAMRAACLVNAKNELHCVKDDAMPQWATASLAPASKVEETASVATMMSVGEGCVKHHGPYHEP